MNFIENDFRNVDYSSIGPFKIYLFDGPHEEIDQYDGLRLPLPCLDEEFVFIVDDWNWKAVRDGTFSAIVKSNLTVKYGLEIRTTLDGSHPENAMQNSDWHNGYFISVLSKS